MKLMTIWLTNKCNFDCYYCVAKGGIEPPGFELPPHDPARRINNKDLLAWIKKWLNPKEWVLEFTGGEPGLYPEIDELIPELTSLGYFGAIQTNGSLPIPHSPNFVRTAAWHFDKRPKFYDTMIIIKIPDGTWAKKEKWCKENGVPYRLTQFNKAFENLQTVMPEPEPCVITHYGFINAYGQIANCHKEPFNEEKSIRAMSPPPNFKLADSCPHCGNVKAVEYALEKLLFPPKNGKFMCEYPTRRDF